MSNPSAANASTQQQPADVQQLIGLLDSLMPFLLRLQSQSQFQSPAGFANSGFVNAVSPQPALDYQAAVDLASDITAASLRNLSIYLETYAGRHTGLESCVPIVTQAARNFAARNFAQAFDLIWQAYRVIALVRASDPQLPPLQASDSAGAPGSSPATSIH
jgi:hypothetical protein